MRAFFALELPDSARQAVAALNADVGDARWTRPHALHLTLRFLGETSDDARALLVTSARAQAWAAPEITLRGVGTFGSDLARARVLWVGVAPDPALSKLATELEAIARAVGFPAEPRTFAPHLTLARLSRPRPAALQSFLRKHAAFSVPAFRARELVLFRSHTEREGARYEALERFPLT